MLALLPLLLAISAPGRSAHTLSLTRDPPFSDDGLASTHSIDATVITVGGHRVPPSSDYDYLVRVLFTDNVYCGSAECIRPTFDKFPIGFPPTDLEQICFVGGEAGACAPPLACDASATCA